MNRVDDSIMKHASDIQKSIPDFKAFKDFQDKMSADYSGIKQISDNFNKMIHENPVLFKLGKSLNQDIYKSIPKIDWPVDKTSLEHLRSLSTMALETSAAAKEINRQLNDTNMAKAAESLSKASEVSKLFGRWSEPLAISPKDVTEKNLAHTEFVGDISTALGSLKAHIPDIAKRSDVDEKEVIKLKSGIINLESGFQSYLEDAMRTVLKEQKDEQEKHERIKQVLKIDENLWHILKKNWPLAFLVTAILGWIIRHFLDKNYSW